VFESRENNNTKGYLVSLSKNTITGIFFIYFDFIDNKALTQLKWMEPISTLRLRVFFDAFMAIFLIAGEK